MINERARLASQEDVARIAQFNRTNAPFPSEATIPELLDAAAAAHAGAPAVICDHDTSLGSPSLTYAQLHARVNQLAHRLRAEGVGPGHVVAVMVERSFAMTIGILAVIKAGAAYLPIAADSPPDRIAYMLGDAGVAVMIVHRKTARHAPPRMRAIDLDDPAAFQGAAHTPRIVNSPTDLAYVIYTSGSTGRPKGVMISHRALINRLHWMQHAYPIGVGDVLLQKTPFSFDVSVWELFWWALHGAALCHLMPGGERNPMAIVDTVQKRGVSVIHFVPSMLNVFLEYLDGKHDKVRQGLASVRRVFASGEALTPSHVRKFNAIIGANTRARLTNLYGPTEATVDVTYYDCPSGDVPDVIPIGQPIHNTQLYILSDGAQVAIGEPGELCIGGVGVARGYVNNAALTRERFTDNPVAPGERVYRTGDVARWRDDGMIEYLGREDHQVKIRGLRIELGEIENTIREYRGIADCVAVVKQYSENVILIIAYIVAAAPVDVDGLRAHLKRLLPDYMIPHRFERIDAIPVTPSGKADRKALPEPAIQVGSA